MVEKQYKLCDIAIYNYDGFGYSIMNEEDSQNDFDFVKLVYWEVGENNEREIKSEIQVGFEELKALVDAVEKIRNG